jgi:Flp pilus assembly protein TadG
MWGIVSRLGRDTDGTVAPTVALALIGLIAVGGVAFDYAHLASMDTELQQAADQAALAAATQLDGQSGAIARATAAAQSLITNKTMFASGGGAVTVPTLVFCSAFDDSVADTATACTTTTTDANAHVVWVKIGGRTANYTLTPVVGLFNSGTIGAEAVAGLSSAICKEPPVMMCNPNSDPSKFNVNNFIGKGMLLIATGGGGSYAPGNFGFLDVGAGASDLGKLMGYGSPPDKCVQITQPTTETGSLTSVIDQFNTRFDIYESGDSIGCFGQAKCPPSLNSRKDVVMNHSAPFTKTNCGVVTGGGQNGWQVSNNPFRPVLTPTTDQRYYLNYQNTPDAMGYPRDKCHSFDDTGNCDTAFGSPNARIGTGDWAINTYWRVNHPRGTTNGAVADPAGGLDIYDVSLNSTIRAAFPSPVDGSRTYPTRYQVYRWEMANAATQLTTQPIGSTGLTAYGQPICEPPGWTAGGTTADRRTLPVAVVNCTGLNGKSAVNPIDWIDTFLVQPSLPRSGPSGTYTQTGDIYVEVIGHTGNGTGGSTTQVIRHDRPYLIR